jgi:hypothetical protein
MSVVVHSELVVSSSKQIHSSGWRLGCIAVADEDAGKSEVVGVQRPREGGGGVVDLHQRAHSRASWLELDSTVRLPTAVEALQGPSDVVVADPRLSRAVTEAVLAGRA